MRRILLFIGAFVLLYSAGIEAKKGKSKNQRNFWDIWGSDSEPATAAGDDLFLENEGSGTDSIHANTHGDDEDFDVGSGDGDIATQKTKTDDYDDYDEYYDYDGTTEKPGKDKHTDDEDLYDGSGSGEEIYEPEKIVPIETVTEKSTPLSPCQQLRASALNVAEFVPMCTPEGAFEKKQCISSTKECWCVNPNGVEIPGTRLKDPVIPDCDFGTSLTTCVFQLVQHSQGLIGQYKPKCTLDGQFEPIQCQDSECWCVDKMGNEILGTFVKLPEIPDCGDKEKPKPTVPAKTKEDNYPYKPFEPKKGDDSGYTIPEEEEPDNNVIVQVGPDKIDIDSEEDREKEEEKTNKIGDKQTVYVDKVQTSPLMAKPGLLAAIIAGAVVGLLLMILLVMFIVYRMRKKDEGSYPLDEQKYQNYPYAKAPTKEFYA